MAVSRALALWALLICGAVAAEPPAAIPDDAALEAGGARIGRIEYRIGDVFDPAVPEEDTPLYRLANRLHIDTRPQALQSQLLFREGDSYSRHALAESERLLREQRYLFDAHIRPIRYYDNTVDVEVRTRDVWTLNPGVSFKRRGGENAARFEIEDTNLLGRGKRLQFARSSDVDRTEWTLGWNDPNVWGSRWRLDLALAESSDGNQQEGRFEQPFYSLDTRRAVGVAAAHWDRIESRYVLGEVGEQYAQNERRLDLYGGWSNGLRNGWTRRWLAGYRYDSNDFSQSPTALPAAQVPADRTLSYPWVGVQWLQDDFRTTQNLNQIGRTEDLRFGFAARFDVGWSGDALGATRNSVIVSSRLADGFEPAPDHFVFVDAGLGGRLEGGSAKHALVSLNGRYYARTGPGSVFFASAGVLSGSDLDADTQILLGGDSGLRGYPLRYQSGSGRALVTLEQRVYTDWYPFRLVRIGAAAFLDAGRTWGRGPIEVENRGWLTDVGVGLRFGMSRSGLGNVLHVDLAFPLQRDDGVDGLQFQVETRRSF